MLIRKKCIRHLNEDFCVKRIKIEKIFYQKMQYEDCCIYNMKIVDVISSVINRNRILVFKLLPIWHQFVQRI